MGSKRIFCLNGHPADTSLNKHLIETYAGAARNAGHEVRLTHLRDLNFDPDYGYGGYETWKPLEPDLEQMMADLEWSEHFVLAAPLWWGSLPAKLKGMFDRAFLPGRAFDPRNTLMGMPAPLLTGRTGRIIITSGTPNLFLRLMYKNAMHVQVRKQIFEFVGVKPVRISQFGDAAEAKPTNVEKWGKELRRLAAKAE